MSCCNSLVGVTFSCLSNSGGVAEIYLLNQCKLGEVTVADGYVTGLTSSECFVKFQFNKNTSSSNEEATVSLENGTTFYTQTITLVIPRREVAKRNAILLLADGQPELIAIVKDYNGAYWLFGSFAGLNLTGLTTGSGTTKTDANGYSITLTGEEPYISYEIDPTIIPGIVC